MPASPDTKRILLAGATGYVGRALVTELRRRGHHVVAVVRPSSVRAALPGEVEVRTAELTDAESMARALGDLRVDAAVSCIASRTGVPHDAWQVDHQANVNLLAAARGAGASHFVLLSAICVQKPRLAFQRAKLAFEAKLAASGIDFTIVRPTAFFKSLAGQVERVRSGKPFVMFGDGTTTACKPIGERDLARFMVDCLNDPARRNRTLPIGGPGEAITPRQQGELLFELLEKPPKFRRVPPAIFTAARLVLAPLGLVMPSLTAKAELARIGHYYATESMLVWDDEAGQYDAAATPSFGTETLRDFYRRVLAEGMTGQELGDHKLF